MGRSHEPERPETSAVPDRPVADHHDDDDQDRQPDQRSIDQQSLATEASGVLPSPGSEPLSGTSPPDPFKPNGQPMERLQAPTPRVGLLIAALVILGVIFYLASSALTPFLIGLVSIYVLDPAVNWVARRRIGRWRLPRGLAVVIVYLATALILIEGLAILLGPLISQILEFSRDLPRLLETLEQTLRGIGDSYQRLELPTPIREAIDRALQEIADSAGSFDWSSLLPLASTIAGTIAGIFGYLIVPVWMFYILKDRPRLTADFDRLLPPSWKDDVWAVLRIVERVFGRWLRGQLLLGLIVGVATFVGLMILGAVVDPRFAQFAVLLAVVAGLFELLPIIGPILSMIPTLLIALTVDQPVPALLAVFLLYLIVQQVENNVLVPIVQAGAIELHPSIVIFALIVGGSIAGLIGAIFALPITAAARDVYRYLFRRLSPDDPAIPPPEATTS